MGIGSRVTPVFPRAARRAVCGPLPARPAAFARVWPRRAATSSVTPPAAESARVRAARLTKIGASVQEYGADRWPDGWRLRMIPGQRVLSLALLNLGGGEFATTRPERIRQRWSV